ncbi:fibronectin type III domain-containing protein [Nocardioides kongjuensis]|uniref:Endonuclease/exonuclease/phosphatase family metal-dependent hydrolase n=1 Tax=Nocardioides kongjuensis TaxID=349522 RepID=A0A852RTI4_9ACTN|nr:fibronectin type III domain-containing protein [Nocardioides kongjuensis]NYD32180.1 endonuclease/exonuclease/phosphatase family metal-dependent hydrolase [Nocardioides kongjuensis]
MRSDTTPRRARQLLLAAIAVLLCTTGLVAGSVEPASAAPKPARVKGVKLKKPRVDGTTASFKVKWKRAARATSYKVQWRAPGGKAHKDRTRTTSLTIKGLAQGTDYCVRVRAYNGKRKGKWSKTRCRTTARLAPVQPVWVDRQQVQGATVTLTFRWNEVAGATSYDLDYLGNENPIQGAKNKKRVTVPGNGSGVASVTLGGFDPGRTYCFQVRPSGPAGVGAFATAGCKRTEPLSRATGGSLAVNMMTWNVCSGSGDNCDGQHPWADRAAAAKARVAAVGPDAVAFQESAPAINDLDDTPGYALGCRIGDGYPGDPVLGGSRNQSLIVKTSKFTIVPNSARGVRFTGYTHGGCWVKVTDGVTGRQLVLASLHLAPPSQASDQTRANQAAVFWASVSADAAGLPVVIGGDFNSDRGSGWDGAREFLNSFGYDDAYDVAESYNALPYLNSFTEWSPVPRIFPRWGGHIDRVFVPPNARVTSWQTEEPYANGRWTSLLSDHAPVRVTVTIP